MQGFRPLPKPSLPPLPPTSAATAETAADTTPAAQEFNVAIVQQLDHASLDEIRTAIVAQLQALAQEKGIKVNIQESTARMTQPS